MSLPSNSYTGILQELFDVQRHILAQSQTVSDLRRSGGDPEAAESRLRQSEARATELRAELDAKQLGPRAL